MFQHVKWLYLLMKEDIFMSTYLEFENIRHCVYAVYNIKPLVR